MPIPQSNTPEMFDHSSYQDKWDRHGRGQVLDGDGAFHRSTTGILFVSAPAGPRSRCGSTRSLGWGLGANRPARRAVQISAGSDSLRIFVHAAIVPCLFAEAYAPVRRRNSDKCFSFPLHTSCKKCIRRNKCKLRRLATIRFHIVRTLFAFPRPCC